MQLTSNDLQEKERSKMRFRRKFLYFFGQFVDKIFSIESSLLRNDERLACRHLVFKDFDDILKGRLLYASAECLL